MTVSRELLTSILRRVESGEVTFSPTDESVETVQSFQPTIAALKFADESGFVGAVAFPQPSKRRGAYYGLVHSAVVRGGLTPQGKEFLSAPPRRAPSQFRKWATDNLTLIIGAVIATLLATYVARLWWGP